MDPRFSDRDSFRKALEAAARELDGSVRDGPGEAWTVSAGTPICSNPNGAPWGAVASLAEGAWGLSPKPISFPWTRRRAEEIAAVRTRQLESLLRTPRTAEPHEREPLTAGGTFAARAEAFSWIAAAAALATALTLILLTLAALPLLERELDRMFQRAEVLTRIGSDPLPRKAELEGLGIWGRLGAAFLLATPIAFFLGGLHAAVHALGEKFLTVARFAPWCSLFLGVSTFLALLPRTSPLVSVAAGFLVPGAALFGTTLAWGRRRDQVRTGPKAKMALRPGVVAAALLILLALFALVPGPVGNEERIQGTSRFRDRFLLGHELGRAFARFYYNHTLYAAEPVKPVYVDDPHLKSRQVRTVLTVGKFGSELKFLKELEFSVESTANADTAAPLIEKKQHDVYLLASSVVLPIDTLRKYGLLDRTICLEGSDPGRIIGTRTVTAPATKEALQKVLHETLKFGPLESMLLELTWLGWTGVFYAGPVFGLVLALGLLGAIAAWVVRRCSARTVRGLLACVFVVSIVGLIAAFVMRAAALGRVAELRNLPVDDQKSIDRLATGLKDPDPDVRYEAAYRAFLALKLPSFPRGGVTTELLAGARDPDVRVRLWCVAALGLTREDRTRETILQAMDDPDLLVRYRAAEGLEYLDAGRRPIPSPTIAKLREMMRTRSWYEGMYALAALRRIDPTNY
ncbi:MAG TPA: HEAT repeat domain-containing protein [Planctomycetota bacterium]|nr:HEAT repeat domain-containing protein [Planctomycetota bacterium]